MEARLAMPLGGAGAPPYGAPYQEDSLHITLDEQRPPAKRALTANEQRDIALGRAEAPGGYQPNGRSPTTFRAAPSQAPPPRQPAPPRFYAAQSPAHGMDQRHNITSRCAS